MQYVIALDQGTTSSRAIVFDRAGRHSRRRAAGIPPALPAARLGRARRRRNLGHASPACRPRRWRWPASGARDIAAIGITNQRETTVVWDRATGRAHRQRHRLAGPAHGAALRRAARARATRRLFPRKTGLVLDAYFSGTKLRWLLDHVPGARERAATRRAGLRHHRHLADLEPDRRRASISPTRPTPPARCCSTSTPATGTTNCWRCSTCRATCCREVGPVQRRLRAAPRIDGADIPIAGIAGDQQAALFGQACLAPGDGQEHLRHRLLPADEHRHGGRDVAQQPADDHRVAARRRHRLRAGRQRLHRRRGRAVAARRPRDHPHVRRGRDAGAQRSGQRRRLSGAGIRRPRRAALGCLCARRDLRPHARHDRRPHRARRAGGHRLPERRRARRDGKGRRHHADGTARGRRRIAPTTC